MEGSLSKVTVNKGVGAGTVTLILLMLVVIVAIAFYFYQSYLRKSVRTALREEVMLEVKTQMQDYHPLEEDAIPEQHRESRPLVS